jgi:hypothetical protein
MTDQLLAYIEIQHEEPVVIPAVLLNKGALRVLLMTSASDDTPRVYEIHINRGSLTIAPVYRKAR